MAFFKVIFLMSALCLSAFATYKLIRVFLLFIARKKQERQVGAALKSKRAARGAQDSQNSQGNRSEFHVKLQALLEKLEKFNKCSFIEKKIKNYSQARYAKRLRNEMPEAIRFLCIALDSGSSLIQAFKYAAQNCNNPLAHELQNTVWDLEAGQSFDEAMQKLKARCKSSEFAYLAAAMEIQHCSGGSMSIILQSVSESLQQSTALEQKLATKTAQARLSARIVAIMPFALLVLLIIFSPGYMGMFFSSALGILMLVCAFCLEFAGLFLIRRFMTIDLNAHLGGDLT